MTEEALIPYKGQAKNVVVYNTYAAGRSIHFDVFIPTDKADVNEVPKEYDEKAVEYAKEFLKLIGKPDTDLQVNICYRCHIDNTDLYEDELWKLPDKDVYIWPMEGCPKPNRQ
ncbi:MAG: DUF2024 family protein [Candidatus Nitrosothermus koennekii]|nr:MAG: DUF2024 family protein [Candidatus Nitrosothermus koennekii]